MVYDDVLKITWLQDANYAQTSGYDTAGQMDWNAAMTWANNLSYGGYDDWRLPSALNYQDGSGPCFGFNCTSSEMGHLYYIDGITPTSMGPFINVQDYVYWSGTEHSPGDPSPRTSSSATATRTTSTRTSRCLPGRCGPENDTPCCSRSRTSTGSTCAAGATSGIR
jgi:hypothetical protein